MLDWKSLRNRIPGEGIERHRTRVRIPVPDRPSAGPNGRRAVGTTPREIVRGLTEGERLDLVGRTVEKAYGDGRDYSGTVVATSDRSLKVRWSHDTSPYWLHADEGAVKVGGYASGFGGDEDEDEDYGFDEYGDEDEDENEDYYVLAARRRGIGFDGCEDEGGSVRGTKERLSDVSAEFKAMNLAGTPQCLRLQVRTPRALAATYSDLVGRRIYKHYRHNDTRDKGTVVGVSDRSIKVRWNATGNERWLRADEGDVYVLA